MGLLIAYGTTECRTRKMAQAVASRICESSHNVDWFAALGYVADRHSKPFDGIGNTGPLHGRWHPESVEISGIKNRGKLQARLVPFAASSLAMTFAGKASNARIHLGNTVETEVWQPDQGLLAAEQSGMANMVVRSPAPSPRQERSARSPELKFKRPAFESLGT